MPKLKFDLDRLANGPGAERHGQVQAGAGYYGTAQLAQELMQRLRVPAKGGRSTDPSWTELRAVPFRRATLERLQADARHLHRATMIQAAAVAPVEPWVEEAKNEVARRSKHIL